MLFHVCYAGLMTTKTDTLIHLPKVNAGPWKHFRGYYERSVSFNCDRGIRRYALLKVYTDDKGDSLIMVRLDGKIRELWVGEGADPFSVANETLLALSSDCDCHNNPEGEYHA